MTERIDTGPDRFEYRLGVVGQDPKLNALATSEPLMRLQSIASFTLDPTSPNYADDDRRRAAYMMHATNYRLQPFPIVETAREPETGRLQLRVRMGYEAAHWLVAPPMAEPDKTVDSVWFEPVYLDSATQEVLERRVDMGWHPKVSKLQLVKRRLPAAATSAILTRV